MDEFLGHAISLAIIITAAALAAYGLGVLHVPVSFTNRWAGCVLITCSGRLAALTMGPRQ